MNPKEIIFQILVKKNSRKESRVWKSRSSECRKSSWRVSITTLSIPPSVDDIDALSMISRIIRRYIIRQLIPPRNYKSSSTPRDNKLDEIIRAYKVSWKKWASALRCFGSMPTALISISARPVLISKLIQPVKFEVH